ncbi:DUF1289 domain-containing protein [Oryzibacter oryziterrae]|uniref:DUF1289 domain-containing protein n=1 Tax=Oryzibacter oryziterrae TaxID=2766474 RepID=UPI001F2F2EA9|nr:DUF1289 domain-containing protein [Oryzibacter oryziterrae]
MSAIKSPCIKVCVIDPATEVCRGCRRTLDEIANWIVMSADERDVILRRLAKERNGDDI